jgi:hypothetical protein
MPAARRRINRRSGGSDNQSSTLILAARMKDALLDLPNRIGRIAHVVPGAHHPTLRHAVFGKVRPLRLTRRIGAPVPLFIRTRSSVPVWRVSRNERGTGFLLANRVRSEAARIPAGLGAHTGRHRNPPSAHLSRTPRRKPKHRFASRASMMRCTKAKPGSMPGFGLQTATPLVPSTSRTCHTI